MKSQLLVRFASTLLMSSGLLLTSCHKKNLATSDDDQDTTEAADHSAAENAANDIMNVAGQVADENGNSLAGRGTQTEETLGSCAIVKRDTIHKVDTVIFNNSVCFDGRMRNGMLIFDYSASASGAMHYRNPGFKCSVKSNNYIVEGKSIEIINKTIENTTPSAFDAGSTNLTWKITGDIKVHNANGVHEINYTRFKTLLNTANPSVYHGQSTAITWSLARVGITGSASGTTAKGRSYTMNITKQLVRDFGGCVIENRHPFIEGTLEFTPGSRPTRTVDFGNGSCDLDATVSIKNKTFNIKL